MFQSNRIFAVTAVERKPGEPYMTIAGVTITDDMVNLLRVRHSNNSAVRARAENSPKQSNSHRDVSDLLDNLLKGYDNSIRPDFGGPPAVVEVDIMVRSMGPISEVDMVTKIKIHRE